jgi:hypothetical protein
MQPQGLKLWLLLAILGTTDVMPCYKALKDGLLYLRFTSSKVRQADN